MRMAKSGQSSRRAGVRDSRNYESLKVSPSDVSLGKKRLHNGDIKHLETFTKANSLSSNSPKYRRRQDTNLKDDIMALGGNDSDLELVRDLDSDGDSVFKSTDGLKTLSNTNSLQLEVADFAKSLKIEGKKQKNLPTSSSKPETHMPLNRTQNSSTQTKPILASKRQLPVSKGRQEIKSVSVMYVN